jgi:hypothetical protein
VRHVDGFRHGRDTVHADGEQLGEGPVRQCDDPRPGWRTAAVGCRFDDYSGGVGTEHGTWAEATGPRVVEVADIERDVVHVDEKLISLGHGLRDVRKTHRVWRREVYDYATHRRVRRSVARVLSHA